MGNRGRSSSASLSVITGGGRPGPLEVMRRPAPPEELTDEQSAEWLAVVGRLPADWFPRETHAMLAQYCRHVVASHRIAQLIEAVESEKDFDLAQYDTLLKMQEREGRALSSLATRMRLSQQATFDKQKKKPLQGKAPWEPRGSSEEDED